MPQEVLWDVRLTISEAATNVVLHAYRDAVVGRRQELVLQADAHPNEIVFCVADTGCGLKPRTD